MRATLTRIIMTGLAVMTLAAFTTPSAFADGGSDLPSGPGVVSDYVMVSGTYEALGYTGGFFGSINQDVVSVSDTFIGYATIAANDLFTLRWGGETLWRDESCAGDMGFVLRANVLERRDDGAVRVELGAWTFDECRLSDDTQDGWGREDAWVAPNESVGLTVFARNYDGSVTISATFTNIYTREIDTSFLERAYVDFPIRRWYDIGEYRVGILALDTEQPRVRKSPKIHTSEADKPIVDVVDPDVLVIGTDEPDTSAAVKDETRAAEQPAVKDETRATEESGGDESPKIDTSEWDTPLVTVPVPLPPLNLDPDPKGSVFIDAIDLTNVVDLADLVRPSITIPVLPSFGGSFDF